MKWMLFVLVFGSHPVETNLLFDSIDACLKAEETMRTEYARAYSQGTWGFSCRRVERSLRGQQEFTNGKRTWSVGEVPTEPTTKKPRHGVAPGLRSSRRDGFLLLTIGPSGNL